MSLNMVMKLPSVMPNVLHDPINAKAVPLDTRGKGILVKEG